MNPDQRAELETLIDALCEERAGEPEMERLNALLQDDPEAQRHYLHRIDLHHALRWQVAGAATRQSLAQLRPSRRLAIGMRAAAAALLALALGWTALRTRAEGPVTPVARVEDRLLGPGVFRLDSGTARLAFLEGPEMLLAGPAEAEIEHGKRVLLRRGTATVWSPPRAADFEVAASDLTILNRGAEFGLNVQERGRARLHVFDGEIRVRLQASPSRLAQTLTLTGGEGLQLEADGTLLANIMGDTPSFARLRGMPDPEAPMLVNSSFEYPRARDASGLAAAGWVLQVHPLANANRMDVESVAGVVDGQGGGTPRPAEGQQWGFLNARTYPDGRTYSTSMHQAVGRMVPGATYELTARVALDGRSFRTRTPSPAYTVGLYLGTPEKGPSVPLQVWQDPALPAPGSSVELRLLYACPRDESRTDRTLFLRVASVPAPEAEIRRVLIDDLRLRIVSKEGR